MQSVDSVQCISGKGICGDSHADGSDRQVSALPLCCLQQIEQMKQGRPCMEKMQVNLVIADAENVSDKACMQFGDVILRVTKKGRPCHGICDLADKKDCCPLVENLFFAVVEKSGTLYVGTKGELL